MGGGELGLLGWRAAAGCADHSSLAAGGLRSNHNRSLFDTVDIRLEDIKKVLVGLGACPRVVVGDKQNPPTTTARICLSSTRIPAITQEGHENKHVYHNMHM